MVNGVMDNIIAAHSVQEWLSRADPNEWLVDGLILNKSLNLLKAKREAGKSLLAVDLAVALVHGETEWLGRRIGPGSPGGVCFLVTDAGAEIEIARQLDRLGVMPYQGHDRSRKTGACPRRPVDDVWRVAER
jgi:RecA-family ATPase